MPPARYTRFVDVHVQGLVLRRRGSRCANCSAVAQLRDAVLGDGATAKDAGKRVQEVRLPTRQQHCPSVRTGALRHVAAFMRTPPLWAALTPALVVRMGLQKAKDIFNIFQDSTSAFVEGHREAAELHDKPQPAAGSLMAGEPRQDTSSAAQAESPEASNDRDWSQARKPDPVGQARPAEMPQNLEGSTRAP